VQVLAFYESQFGAVFGLALDLLLLYAVRQIAAEAREDAAQPRAEDLPPRIPSHSQIG
jgi:hypothetical protein